MKQKHSEILLKVEEALEKPGYSIHKIDSVTVHNVTTKEKGSVPPGEYGLVNVAVLIPLSN